MMKSKISETRKKEIIEGFYHLAKENGLENTSIAKIGKHLGIPPSLVMHYFPTKDNLILNLISYILDQYLLIYKPKMQELKESQEHIDPKTFVDRLFSRDWNQLFDDGVFYSCFALIFRNEVIKREYRKLHEKLRESLKEILDKDENLREKDTQLLAEQIFVVVEGAYYYLSMIDDEKSYNQKLDFFKGQVYDLLQKEVSSKL
ncbi:TetR family transcriptional regulator [Echinicola salinicaeni]|uniref:TetR family transcriptional regulator n=1 Tax=Echinicola salinicaeni TaxID=2762757 RepID=UPI001E2DF0D4|nr:TetR family transcriptional regulator [Echinicola salinicaeni]